jgi:hypothetical protein
LPSYENDFLNLQLLQMRSTYCRAIILAGAGQQNFSQEHEYLWHLDARLISLLTMEPSHRDYHPSTHGKQ